MQFLFEPARRNSFVRFLSAAIALVAIAWSVALLAEQPESPTDDAGADSAEPQVTKITEQTKADLPGIVLCEKAVSCQADAKDDPTFFGECEAFVRRAQVHPKAVDAMESCAEQTQCSDYHFVDCMQVYGDELNAAGVPRAEFQEIVSGEKQPVRQSFEPTPEQLAQFDELCTTVVKCDAQTQGFPDPHRICTQFMASIETKFPEKIPRLKECLTEQSCEEQNFAECLAEIARGMSSPEQDSPDPENESMRDNASDPDDS